MNQRRIVIAALAGIALTVVPAAAQEAKPRPVTAPSSDRATSDRSGADQDIEMFRKDFRSLKKQTVSANLELTDEQAQQFWPIYDRYIGEKSKIIDKKYDLLKEYARNYSTITDEQADSYITGRARVEQSVLELRIKYQPIFRKVLSGKSLALFAQLDWRLDLVMELELASQVPMVQP